MESKRTSRHGEKFNGRGTRLNWKELLCRIGVFKLFFLAISLNSVVGSAAVNIQSVTGATSNVQGSGNSVTVYASRVGTDCSSSVADTATCDACASANFGDACSTKYVSTSNYFFVNFTADEAGTLEVTTSGDDPVDVNNSSTSVLAKTPHTIKLRWSSFEGLYSTSNQLTVTITVKTAASGTTGESKVTATLYLRRQTAGGNFSECSANAVGICDFSLFEGDEKAYVTLGNASDYPTQSSDKNNFSGIRVYYFELTEAEDAVESNCPNRDTTSICGLASRFTYAIKSFDIDIGSGIDFDDIIPDLENNKKYCFAVVNKDLGSNLGYQVNANAQTDTTTGLKCVKARPSEVVGFLTKEANCFIATAAFGSALHPKVETFRLFRNKVLMPHRLGRQFVSWYYKIGPHWAKHIEKNETAKTIVRLVLWPLWLMSLLVLNVSPVMFLLFLIVGCILIFFRLRRNSTIVGIAFFLALPSFSLNAQESESSPPREAPFVEEEESLPLTEPSDEMPVHKKKAHLEESIRQDEEELAKDNERLNKLEEQIKDLQRQKQMRRNQLGSKSDKVLELDSKERAARNPVRSSSRTREIFYGRKESSLNYTSSLRVGNYSPVGLYNSETGLYFDAVYTESNDILVFFDFEYLLLQSVGRLGIKFETGLYTAKGKGRFKNNPTALAREEFTFALLPNSLGGIYSFQYWDRQIIVPFAETGLGYFTFVEVRDDFKRTKYGGNPVGYWSAGLSFLLDLLAPRSMSEVDIDYGVNHIWLVAQYKSYFDIGGNFDFSADSINAGIKFDF